MATWTLLLAAVIGASAPEVQIQTLRGDAIHGSIVKLNDQELTLQTAAGQVSLHIDKLLALAPKAAPAQAAQPSVWVNLVDGSRLAVQDYAVQGNRATLVFPEGNLEVPTADVASVRFHTAADAAAAQWEKLKSQDLDTDVLVVGKDQALDYHKGVLHDVTDKVVQFSLEGELLPVKRAKIYGVLYHHPAGRELPTPSGGLTDASGSKWMARSIVLEGDRLHWTTLTGLAVTRPFASVARIDFSEGKVLFLSDMKPESVTWTPFFGTSSKFPLLGEFFAPRQDRALESKPLRLGNKQYAKGLALHSRTEMVYRLPGRFRRFVATVGIDESVRPRGNVQLIIRGDDRVLLDKTVTGTDAPLPVDLDISGVGRLTILVDFGEDLDVGDHLDLCEARVIK